MTLAQLLDVRVVERSLRQRGLHRAAADRLTARFVRQAQALQEAGVEGERESYAFFVPGRIEVLGKHTDYAGGSSLTCATERGFAVVAVPRDRDTVRLVDTESGETSAYAVQGGGAAGPGPTSGYAEAVVRRAARNFPGALRGGEVRFSSDLPQAAGMSSSSAFIVAVFLALRAIGKLADHPAYQANITSRERLAHYLGSVENGQTFRGLEGDQGVGTFGGSQDHTAILCSEPGVLRRYAYAPTRLEQTVALPEGFAFVIASSGVVAEKTGGAREHYNRAAHLAAEIAEAWRAAAGSGTAHLGDLLTQPGFSLPVLRQVLRDHAAPQSAQALTRRFAHFYLEHHLILPAAIEALGAGDLAAFGRLVNRSQRCAEKLLGNQVNETIFLVREARQLGAVAASAFGAGFGGSVWALVEADEAEAFVTMWAERYRAAFPEAAQQARFFTERPGPAAFRLGA